MRTKFVFPSPTELPPFEADYGELKNITCGPDVEMFKWFMSQRMSGGKETTFVVFGTERTWKTKSSFIGFRAVARICPGETAPSESTESTADLYLIVLEGRHKETLISAYRLSDFTCHPKDFEAPVANGKAEPLPSAEDLRMEEKYGNRALSQIS